jgi:hypothetical protein
MKSKKIIFAVFFVSMLFLACCGSQNSNSTVDKPCDTTPVSIVVNVYVQYPTPTPEIVMYHPTAVVINPEQINNIDANATMFAQQTQNAPTPIPTSKHPIGSSGRCVDGSYTYSAHKSGTCSHHGGIAEWWGN